jgi:hypothetical protein
MKGVCFEVGDKYSVRQHNLTIFYFINHSPYMRTLIILVFILKFFNVCKPIGVIAPPQSVSTFDACSALNLMISIGIVSKAYNSLAPSAEIRSADSMDIYLTSGGGCNVDLKEITIGSVEVGYTLKNNHSFHPVARVLSAPGNYDVYAGVGAYPEHAYSLSHLIPLILVNKIICRTFKYFQILHPVI